MNPLLLAIIILRLVSLNLNSHGVLNSLEKYIQLMGPKYYEHENFVKHNLTILALNLHNSDRIEKCLGVKLTGDDRCLEFLDNDMRYEVARLRAEV